jgi:hypothetical protein
MSPGAMSPQKNFVQRLRPDNWRECYLGWIFMDIGRLDHLLWQHLTPQFSPQLGQEVGKCLSNLEFCESEAALGWHDQLQKVIAQNDTVRRSVGDNVEKAISNYVEDVLKSSGTLGECSLWVSRKLKSLRTYDDTWEKQEN